MAASTQMKENKIKKLKTNVFKNIIWSNILKNGKSAKCEILVREEASW